MSHSALYSWLAPREDSKKRKVLDRFLAAGGGWVRGSELHEAFGVYGWAWDGAVAQLRERLRARGGDIESEKIDGRDEYQYRLVLPERPTAERSVGGYAPENERVSLGTPSPSGLEPLAGDLQSEGGTAAHTSPLPGTGNAPSGRRPSPSRWQDRVGVSGAARKAGGEQLELREERG